MKTIEINLYSFNELSDKAKEKATSHFLIVNKIMKNNTLYHPQYI